MKNHTTLNTTRWIATTVALALPLLANAANVSLTANDVNGAVTSFNGAGKWGNGAAPSAANDYYTSQFFIRTPTDSGGVTYTFGGNSLTFQQPANGNARSIIVKSGNNDTFVINNLTNALGGILENGGSGNVVSTFTGNLWTIAANSAVMADQGSLQIGFPLAGSSGVVLTNGGGNANGITYNSSNTLFQGIFYLSTVNFGNGGGNTRVILNAANGQPGNPTSFTPNQFWITAGCTLQDNVGVSFTNSNGGFLLNGGGTATINAAANTIVSEPITDVTNGVSSVCSLTKAGSGTLTLSGNNNYSGGTIISAGTLQMGTSSGLTNNSAVTDNGTLDLNGFNTVINTLTGSGIVDTVAGGSPILTIGNGNGTSTFTGTIQNSSGTLSLTKVGAGAFTLSGFAYSGNTIVADGTLNLNTAGLLPSSAGSLIVSNTGVLVIDASSSTAMPANNLILSTNGMVNLTLGSAADGINASGSLDFQDNATMNLTYGTLSSNPAAPAINASGGISASGSNVVINIAATGLQPGTFTLIKYTGTPLSSIANFQVSPPPGVAATLVNNTGNDSIDLNITSIPNQLAWNGVNGTSWDLITPNWANLLAGGITLFQQYTNGSVVAGDSVLFDDTLTNDFINPQPTNVVLNSRFYAFPVVVNSTLPYSIAGAGGIAGVTSLVKSNTGSLALLTSNSFSGGTYIDGGMIIITNDSGLGASSGSVTLNSGELEIQGGVTNNRALPMPTTSAIGVSANNTARLTGIISGAGSLNKYDGGTLALAAAENFTGDLFLHDGLTVIDSGGSLTNGNYWDVGQDTNDTAILTLRGTAALQTTSDFNVGDLGSSVGTLNVSNSASLTVNAFFVGSANVSGSTASGTVNQYGGNVTEVSTTVGEFCIGGRTSISALGVYNMIGGTLTANAGIRVGSTGIGTLNQSGGIINAKGGINIARIAGSFGTNNLNGGTLSAFNIASSTGTNAVFNFNGGTLQANFSPGSPWFSTGIQANILAGGAIIDSSNNNVTVTAPLLAGSANGGLTKLGTGTLTLAGTNTYTGPTTNNAGTLVLNSPSTYPGQLVVNAGSVQMTTATTLQGGAVISNNAVLTINQAGNATTTMGNLIFNGSTFLPGATLALSPTIANNPTVPLVTCSTLTLNGTNTINIPLESVGTIAVIKYATLAGSGNCTNLALPQGAVGYVSNNAANSTLYAVITSTGPGIFWAGGTNSAAGKTNQWDVSGSTNWVLNATPTTYHQVVIPGDSVTFSDSGNGVVNLNTTVGPTSMTISNNSQTYTFSGTGGITGPAGLLKLGTGTAILGTTNNNYLGDTVISNGTLQVINSGVGASLSPSANLMIGSSGTLSLSATIPNPTAKVNEFTGSGLVSYSGGFNSVLSFGSSAGGTWNGTIRDAGGGGLSLTKTGTGTWFIGGSNYLNNADFFNAVSQFQLNGGTTIITNGGLVAIATTECWIGQGAGSTSTVVVANGTLAVSNNFLCVGRSTNASGTLIVNSGTVSKAGNNNIIVGSLGATGTLIVNGGQVLNNGPLWLGEDAPGSGTLDLNGGLVQATVLQGNNTPAVSVANFNGGTLQAVTNSPDYLQVSSMVMSNGLVLDDNGFTLNIGASDALQSGDSFNGGLIKEGSGSVYLDGGNTYTGTTLVTNGFLAGVGSVSGPVVVAPGGNLGAGDAAGIGSFTINNNVTLQGNATLRINKTGGVPSQDQVVVTGNVNYGGILTVTNITSDSTALTTSDTFQLFSAAGTHAGNFSGIAGSPGTGLSYSFDPATGILSIVNVASNPTNITFSVSGNALSLSWPADHLGWILQAQTNNLAAGLLPGAGNWVDISGSSAVTSENITMDPTKPTVFYRLRHP